MPSWFPPVINLDLSTFCTFSFFKTVIIENLQGFSFTKCSSTPLHTPTKLELSIIWFSFLWISLEVPYWNFCKEKCPCKTPLPNKFVFCPETISWRSSARIDFALLWNHHKSLTSFSSQPSSMLYQIYSTLSPSLFDAYILGVPTNGGFTHLPHIVKISIVFVLSSRFPSSGPTWKPFFDLRQTQCHRSLR